PLATPFPLPLPPALLLPLPELPLPELPLPPLPLLPPPLSGLTVGVSVPVLPPRDASVGSVAEVLSLLPGLESGLLELESAPAPAPCLACPPEVASASPLAASPPPVPVG